MFGLLLTAGAGVEQYRQVGSTNIIPAKALGGGADLSFLKGVVS